MQPPDEELRLIERARQADRAAFARLVEQFWGRVHHWLFSLTRDRHASEDLAQETFLKAWRALASYDRGMSFRAWIFRIARNAWIDRCRTAHESAGDVSKADPPSKEQEPLGELIGREGQTLLENACNELPVLFRAAFLLWSREEMSFAEIAASLGVAESTARWRVFKARRVLADRLSTYLDERAK